MTLREAAQIYVDLVHSSSGIACADRFEATRRAFELVGESTPHS